MIKSKKKIIFLTTSFILTICLMGFMGVYALTITKNSMFNVGITYQPEYLVKVEMGIDGANGGTDNQTIEETEYVEIYNSLNPVSNGMYIQSISRDTIRLEANSLTPDAEGFVYFRFYILNDETKNGETKDIFASVNCGETTETTPTLTTDATPLSIQTGVTADNPALLGALKINIKFEEAPYTVHKYVDGTGPVYDNDNPDKSNRYVHYIKMGEYPQTYYGTSLPKSESEYEITADYYYNTNDNEEIIKSTLYEDKITGQKFAKQGTNFYNVEPVRWIVLGVSDDNPKSDGKHILFTSGNTDNWRYNEATKKFEIKNDNEWIDVDEVLVLSEYGLLRSMYKASGYHDSPYYNHFSQSDATKVLNTNCDSLYNTMFTDNQRTKIESKTMPITSYYNGTLSVGQNGLNSTDYTKDENKNDIKYNMFLLGSTRNYNGSRYGLYGTDSYNLGTYFTPANNYTSQSNLVAKETAYSSGGTQDSPDSYSAYTWWLRSGYVGYNVYAMYVHSTGSVDSDLVRNSYALRPAFVLNLA